MTTRPKRTKKDSNQLEIVHNLERLGAVVWDCANIGGEVLDLIVFWRGQAIPVEIKAPGKLDDLTDGELEGLRQLQQVGVEAVVATCTEDVIRAFEERSPTNLPLHYICAACSGIVEVPPDITLLDCGTTLLCGYCAHLTVVDLSTQQKRAERYQGQQRLARLETAVHGVQEVLLDRMRWGPAYRPLLNRLAAMLDAPLATERRKSTKTTGSLQAPSVGSNVSRTKARPDFAVRSCLFVFSDSL